MLAIVVVSLAVVVGCSGGTPGADPPSAGSSSSRADVSAGSGTAAPGRAGTPTPADPQAVSPEVGAYLSDIEGYWSTNLTRVRADRTLVPLQPAVGYRPSDPASFPVCDGARLTAGFAADNAFWCRQENRIVYDAEQLLPTLRERYGDLAVGVLLAHEYGHAVQAQAGMTGSSLARELQADCFAGAWAAGTRLTPTDDRAQRGVLRSYLDSADPAGTDASVAHGSAFDRSSAYARGFGHGAAACTEPAALTASSHAPAAGSSLNATRELSRLVPALTDRLEHLWRTWGDAPVAAPSVVLLSRAGSTIECAGTRPAAAFTDLAISCPGENTIVLDDLTLLPRLWHEHGDLAAGYVVLLTWNRAMLQRTPGTDAAECATGAALADLAGDTAPPELRLSAADLDEAVAGVVAFTPTALPGGASTPPVLRRVDALRVGYVAGVTACQR